MGYTTNFTGQVAVTPPLSAAEVASLAAFAAERHDDYEIPGIPRTPWCQWVPTDDGTAIEWDGGEKFIDAEHWMRYLVATFLAPAGHVVNGIIEAQGQRVEDRWDLVVVDNTVKVRKYGPAAATMPAHDLPVEPPVGTLLRYPLGRNDWGYVVRNSFGWESTGGSGFLTWVEVCGYEALEAVPAVKP
jgi:hypothetical protein